MEIERIAGLPAHPLFVHIPVVLIPLAGLVAIVFAFRPAWLDRFGWSLVALSGVGMIGAIIAAGSGESLEEMIRDNGEEISSTLREHAELGEAARTISIIFFVIVTAVVVFRYYSRKNVGSGNAVMKFAGSKAGATVLAAALVVSAGAASYSVAAAGHNGAKAVWEEEFAASEG